MGVGAFGHDEPTDANNINNSEQSSNKLNNLAITTTRTHRSKKIDNILETLEPAKIIRAGGAGYKALLVLEGKADVYFFPSAGCKRWDTASADAILKSGETII